MSCQLKHTHTNTQLFVEQLVVDELEQKPFQVASLVSDRIATRVHLLLLIHRYLHIGFDILTKSFANTKHKAQYYKCLNGLEWEPNSLRTLLTFTVSEKLNDLVDKRVLEKYDVFGHVFE